MTRASPVARGPLRRAQVWRHEEDGASTVWSIFWCVTFLIITGFVIDIGNAYRFQAAIRMTADQSALAGVMAFDSETKYQDVTGDMATLTGEVRAKNAATALSSVNLGGADNGAVVPAASVTLGTWTRATGFSPGGATPDAVQVKAERSSANGNEVETLLLGLFTAWEGWDIGATAVARIALDRNCETKEGILVAGTLTFALSNVFTGDVCLHGESEVAFSTGSEWQASSSGDFPVVSHGLGGALCQASDCQNSPPYDNVIPFQSATSPLTLDMIDGTSTEMPLVNATIDLIDTTLAAPAAHTAAGLETNALLPRALTSNDGRDPETEAALLIQPPLTSPINLPGGGTGIPTQINGVTRISVSASDFEAAVVAGGTQTIGTPPNTTVLPPIAPFPANTILDIDSGGACTASGSRIELTGDAILDDLVILTSCAVSFRGTNSFSGSYLRSTSTDSTAVGGQAGASIGSGDCATLSDGADVVADGGVNLQSGMIVRGAVIKTRGDATIAAQPADLRGSRIWVGGNASFSASRGWEGCSAPLTGTLAEERDYVLVQ